MNYARTFLSKTGERFDEDAQAWGLSRTRALLIALAPLVVIGVITLLAALALLSKSTFRPIFNFVVAEDSLLEWPQFVFALAAGLMFIWMGIQFIRKGQWVVGAAHLLIGVCGVFVAGEEISWGQRIFGWAEPESLGAINHQKELNVHNIRLVQRAFGFAALFASMYGVGAPLLASFVEALRTRTPLRFLAVPPLFLLPAFLMPFGYRLFRILIWPGTNALVVTYGEGPELCLYFGLMVFAALNLRRLRQDQPAPAPKAAPAGA